MISGIASVAGRWLGSTFGTEATRAALAGPAAPTALAAGGQAGGTLKIVIDGDGKPRVQQLTKNAGSSLDFDVYSGGVMGGAY